MVTPAEYELIKNCLETPRIQGTITEFTKQAILDMSNKVLEHIARNHKNVVEGVKSIMGGKILEYEAKTILKRGLTEGLEKGKLTAYAEMVHDGFISVPDAANRFNISVKEFKDFLCKQTI